ncbi:MAG TPA: P-loop NTPase fold protein, partial [Allosphingosinicella sp.]
MRLRSTLEEGQLSKGFTPENDLFQLADLSKRLTALVRALTQGSVSILDGRWGTGKTTFVKMWVAELERDGIPAIYFDAFAADYIQDPFQAVSSSFIRAAIARKRTDDPVYQRYVRRAAKAAKRIAGVTTKAGVKLVTLGALGAAEIDQLTALKDDIGSSLGEISEEAVKTLLEQHANDEEVFANLRGSLLELPALLRPVTTETTDNEPLPLVIVIDELDRCRPDFALGILEVLKHFFRTDSLHFVLVTNTQHLALSVAKRYGMSSAAEEYLEKFYDFVVHFEHRYGKFDEGSAGRYVGHLFSNLMPSSALSSDRRILEEHVRMIARAYRFTLRQIERVVTNLALAFLAAPEKEYRPAIILSMLCALKAVRP